MTAEAAPVTLTTYAQWADALAERFFRREYAGSHVMFLVDDVALGEVYGGDPQEALSRLVEAIRPELRRHAPRKLFGKIESATRTWKYQGGEGPPPCLPLLAIAVLAATRMARGSDRGGNNYYRPFIELLDLEVAEHDLICSYGETIPALWKMLQWWLDKKHRGGMGLSTIVFDTHFTRIGYADSQTLFRSSDRDKLTRFLKWLGLKPGEPIGDDELLAYFRLWAARAEDDLTLGAQMMLEEGEDPRQLVEILRRAAGSWQGVLRDDQGRVEASVLITLRPPPRPELAFAAERPRGFPTALRVQRDGQAVELRSDDGDDAASGWYRVPLTATAGTLDDGITLAAEGRVLRLPAAQIYVLHKHPELGCWASVPRLRPGEEAWLVVRNHVASRVEAFLKANARRSNSGPGWTWIDREGVAPPGWRLMRGVIVDVARSPPADGLEPLEPRYQNRLSLQGGLPLSRGIDTYLTGGEPDLWLPDGEEALQLEVAVDGTAQHVTGSLLRMCECELSAGPHEVRLGPISRAFATQRTLGKVTPVVAERLGHAVMRAQSTITARTLDATAVSDGEQAVVIVGASIRGDELDLANGTEAAQRPVVLPVKSKSSILIGAMPGQISWPQAPARKPTWMDIADLDFRVFEYSPSFPVVWVLTEWNIKPLQRARVCVARAPEAASGEVTERMKAWATTVLEWQPPTEAAANQLWDEYMDAAEVVLEA